MYQIVNWKYFFSSVDVKKILFNLSPKTINNGVSGINMIERWKKSFLKLFYFSVNFTFEATCDEEVPMRASKAPGSAVH